MKVLNTLLILLIPFISIAQTPISHVIEASNYNFFIPSELTINLGDTVYFENLILHNAVEVSEETYNSDGIISNGGFELYSDGYVVLEEVGTHYYVCTPHVQMDMKGKIIVNQNGLIGQWYDADNGDYVEFTTDFATLYTFEDNECYEAIQFPIELTPSGFNILNSDETTNINVFNLSDSTFSFVSDDNDTINLSSTSFNIDNWIECNDSINCFDDNETIISIFGEFFINDCSSLIDYLLINYNYNLEQSCNWDGGFMFDLESNLVMDVCECTCEEDIQIITWKCFSGSCYELNDGTGEYNSLEDCELSCTFEDTTWKCSSGICTEVFDLNGEYQSLEECEANCSALELTFNCIFPLNNGEGYCDEILDGTGEFSTFEDCEQECQNVSSINETLIDVNIFPNPSSNIFNLEFNSVSETEISVTNVLGEQVYFVSVQSVGEFNTQIDLSKYSKGIYNLTIKTSDGISNHKLILQ
tara:strand:+ start:2498 stop:3916 length:1419 start_codon:yes stop_codon:yes gene_type:complete